MGLKHEKYRLKNQLKKTFVNDCRECKCLENKSRKS